MLKRRFLIAGVLGAVTLVAACGSSSKPTTSATTSATTAASTPGATGSTPSGTPIKIGIIVPINDAIVSEPYIAQGAKVGVAAVNASGGIDGRPLQLIVCDDQYSPSEAAVCAQKLLVQDKVLMLVGDDGTQDAAIDPTQKAAGTISWGDYGASAAALTDPNTFLLNPLSSAADSLPEMLPAGTTGIAYETADSAIAISSEKIFETYVPKSIKLTLITVPLTATSMQAPCLQIKNSGANVIVSEGNPSQTGTVISTCNSLGLNNVTWAEGTVQVTDSVIQVVSSLHLRNVIAMDYSGQTYSQFYADIAKYGKSVGGVTNPNEDPVVGAWLAVKLLPSIVAGAGSLNPATIKSWLDTQTAFSTAGATPPINFTATPIASLPRLQNIAAYKGEIENGVLMGVDPNPFLPPNPPPNP